MKKIKLKRNEYIGRRTYLAGDVVDLHPDRAMQFVRSGAAEYFTEEIEYAIIEPPETEKMIKPKRRRKKVK